MKKWYVVINIITTNSYISILTFNYLIMNEKSKSTLEKIENSLRFKNFAENSTI